VVREQSQGGKVEEAGGRLVCVPAYFPNSKSIHRFLPEWGGSEREGVISINCRGGAVFADRSNFRALDRRLDTKIVL